MQKISKYLLFIVSFFICLNSVNAKNSTIIKGDKLVDLTLNGKSLEMFYIIDDDNTFLYSYDPTKTLEYTEYKLTPDTNLPIDIKLIRYLKYIAYYGYTYENRNDIDWYIATQFLIWQNYLQDKEALAFKNKEDEAKYKDKISTILKDIDHLKEHPSFTANFDDIKDREPEYIIKLDEELVLTDENKVLQEFIIPNDGAFNYKVEANKLTLTANYPTTSLLSFERKLDGTNAHYTYELNGEATLFTREFIVVSPVYLYVKVLSPTLTINLIKDESYYPSLENSEYGLYYQDNDDLISTFKVNSLEKIIIPELGCGDFYMKEIKNSKGYKALNKKINFTGNNEKDYEFDIKKEALLKTINFKYSLSDSKVAEYEFTIYDIFGNPIKTFMTDSEGVALITLPYGKFIIRNNTVFEGFKNEDIILDIDENTKETLEIVNEELLGTLNLIFMDNLFQEPVNGLSTFKIKKASIRSNEEETFEVNDGAITLESLPLGDYLITNITIPDNYKLASDEVAFSITEEEQSVNLTIYSELKTGSIFIKEIDKLTGNPVVGAIFRIYNSKNELLWEEKTNEEGIIEILNVPVGNYYLKKVLSLDSNIEDEEEIPLEIKEDIKSTITLSNRITEEVPITGINDDNHHFLVDIALSILGGISFYASSKA
ncbi:MAG: SpaA isopeptide-forming pilin-related protein [Ruminococcus sp.]|nr:SpaA isopeptide-forming pilin-related protein [Ruminococcus sp.]